MTPPYWLPLRVVGEHAMNLNDELTILRGIPLFSGIKPEALKLLAFASDRMIFQPGQPLFREGDPATGALVILSGSADILQLVSGKEEKIGEILPSSVVGEVALLCASPRQTTVVANTTVEALHISKDSFQKLMSCCPNTMSDILHGLGEQISKAS